ncbi:MAG TPA: hypothetical protein VGC76_11640 [Pyrinomonadaceae bacterium]|jgi:hypothetical protein
MALAYPSLPTIKRLFAVSGNQCAFPKCPLPLVDEDSGKVTGRICHIKAQNAGGARYDASQTDEERHGFDNLVLMCPIHHDVIDSDEDSYTVERLLKIKSEHEGAFQDGQEPTNEIASTLIDNSQNSVNISLTTSQNQSGGQTANQIYNLLQPNVSASDWENEIQRKRYSHDLEIFKQSDELLPEENLERILGKIFGSHQYRDNDFIFIGNFIEFAEKKKNQYLDEEINEAYNQLTDNLNKLAYFLGMKFFIYPDNQKSENMSFCMQPDLNPDRGMLGLDPEYSGIYSKLTDELNILLRDVQQSYTEYRRAVKENLVI